MVSCTYHGTRGVPKLRYSDLNGTTWINAMASAGMWSASGVTLSAGAGTLQVRTVDLAGNVILGTGHGYTLSTAAQTADVAVVRLSVCSGMGNADLYNNVA